MYLVSGLFLYNSSVIVEIFFILYFSIALSLHPQTFFYSFDNYCVCSVRVYFTGLEIKLFICWYSIKVILCFIIFFKYWSKIWNIFVHNSFLFKIFQLYFINMMFLQFSNDFDYFQDTQFFLHMFLIKIFSLPFCKNSLNSLDHYLFQPLTWIL